MGSMMSIKFIVNSRVEVIDDTEVYKSTIKMKPMKPLLLVCQLRMGYILHHR